MSDFVPYIDLLTGCYKKAHFEKVLFEFVRAAKKNRRPLALLYLDVDDFQSHADLHGSLSVDTALAWLADRVSTAIEGRGPIGRPGDDEFAVVLPETSIEVAHQLAERVRKAASRQLNSSAFGDYRLTVSVGVVELRNGELPGNFLEAGEQACTRAKQAGRDAVVRR